MGQSDKEDTGNDWVGQPAAFRPGLDVADDGGGDFVCGLAGCAFAALGLIFTAVVPSIDHMNYPAFLVGFPISLISNTYFPVRSDITAVQVLIELNPVYHLAETCRALRVTGTVGLDAVKLALTTLGLTVIVVPIVMRLMRRRVLGD